MLAVLYDIHGNLPALEAVLAEAKVAGARRYLLAGDYAVIGGWPLETVARLRELEPAVWIRGDGERWLAEPPPDRPETGPPLEAARSALGGELEALVALRASAELDGILFCHASPRSDVETFAPEPAGGDEALLAGVRGRLVLFGHSHLQFRRPGPAGCELVNPGSVGMPLDGDPRAAWAIGPTAGALELRRTAYDVERAAARLRALAPGWGEAIARRLELGAV